MDEATILRFLGFFGKADPSSAAPACRGHGRTQVEDSPRRDDKEAHFLTIP